MGWYDDYQKRITIEGSTPQEITRTELQETFLHFLNIAPNKYTVYMNEDDTVLFDGIITDKTNIATQTQEKRFDVVYDSVVKTSDYLNWNEEKWLLLNEKDIVTNQNKSFVIEYCNQDLKWMTETGLKSYSCVASSNSNISSSLDDNKPISIQDRDYGIAVQKNEDTILLENNMRFIFGENVYKISFRNSSIVENILEISFLVDQKLEQDDFENGIAYNNEDYTIEIDNADITNVIGYSTTLTSKVYKSGILLATQPQIEWSSSDTNTATVDENGLLNLITDGNATITAKFGNMSDSINVVVQAIAPTNVITFRQNPIVSKVTKFDSNGKIFELNKYINDVISLDINTITYAITQGDSKESTDYTVIITDNSVLVKNINESSASLTFTVDDGIGNSDTFTIRLTSW